MKTIEHFASVTSVLESFIERENETIALFERSHHTLGDTIVTPVILRLIEEKKQQRMMLESALEEVHEQFALDEAII